MDKNFKTQLQAFLNGAESPGTTDSAGTECLSDDEILLIARNTLDVIPEKRRGFVVKHAGGECARCSDLVELMKKSQDNYEGRKAAFLQAVPTKHPVSHSLRYLFEPLWISFTRQPKWAGGAVLLALLLSLGIPFGRMAYLDFTAPPKPLPGLVEALQRIRGDVPDDPVAFQQETEIVKQAVVSGQGEVPTPDEIRKTRGRVHQKAAKSDQQWKQWAVADNDLAMIEVLSNYNKLGTDKGTSMQKQIRAKDIEIRSLTLADGTLDLSASGPLIRQWSFQSLLASSARQTDGISAIRISGPDGAVVASFSLGEPKAKSND